VTIPESEAAARAATVRVELGERGYDIAVGPRLLAEAGARVAAASGARRLAVVTDETVAGLYRDTVDRSLEAAGLRRDWFVVPPGESSKRASVSRRSTPRSTSPPTPPSSSRRTIRTGIGAATNGWPRLSTS